MVLSNQASQEHYASQVKRAAVLLGILFVAMLALRVLPLQLASGFANYLPLHMLLETVAIVIAGMIFVMGWYTQRGRSGLHVVVMATLFLGVAVLDFSHILSFAGMPDFVTESGAEKSINFWLAARLLAALALLGAALLPDRGVTAVGRAVLVVCMVVIVALFHYWFLFLPDTVPDTYIEESGLTPFKIGFEYLLILLYLVVAIIFFQRSLRTQRRDHLALAVAGAILAMAELFFTFYATVTDVFNLAGHLYKVIAYAFLYQALVVTGVKAPFERLTELGVQLQATVDAIPDMLFEMSMDGTFLSYFSDTSRRELMMSPQDFIGRNFRELMPEKAAAEISAALDDIREIGHTRGRTYELLIPGGAHWYELSGSRKSIPGQPDTALMLARNVTDTMTARRQAERDQRILKAALDHLPIGVAVNSVGDEVGFEYMNDNFPRFYGVTRQQLENSKDFWRLVYEDEADRESIKCRVLEDAVSGDPERMKWQNVPIRRRGSETRFVTAQNVPVPEEGLSVSLVEDVTESLRIQNELQIAATAFSSQEGIMITDHEGRILRVNPAFERTTGYTQDEVVGQTPGLLSSGVHDEAFYRQMWQQIEQTGGWHGEIWSKRKNGDIYPQSLTITAIKNSEGQVTHYVGDFIGITDIKKAEQEISQLSSFDPLTGLPNRRKCLELLQEIIDQGHGHGQIGALMMVDLDHFKTINDTYGHTAGDQLLQQIAARLQQQIPSLGMVSRYGGDEFLVLLKKLDRDPTQAATRVQQIAQSILTSIAGNYTLEAGSYYTTCSIGVTLFDGRESTTAELLKQVDIALFQAKDSGRNNIRFFDPAWQSAVNERARLVADLREALRQHQFELYYQPQVSAEGIVIGAEALVRWLHPQRGLLTPGEFLQLVEDSGLMPALGDEVLSMGLQQLACWQQLPRYQNFKLSINVTADQFYKSDFVDKLLVSINDMKLDASHLMLEFTESVLVDNVELARHQIHKLNSAGVRFAIDDFGTGYSSLSYLSQLPLDQLKIDQSFVRNLGKGGKDAAIIHTIIDMALTLGMEVLAEGVETERQRKYLLSKGCTLYQGYLFAKPMPLDEFEQYWERHALLADSAPRHS